MGINKKGFSLIGVIISIFIISTGLVAVLSLSSMSLKGSDIGEMRLIASGLAQEGVEKVRDVRRSNADWIDWEWYGTIAISTVRDYIVQYNNPNLISFSETPLKIDTNGFYQYNSGDATSFYRKVTLTKVSSQEIKVEVEIKWQSRGDSHSLAVEDHLWNWK